MGITLVIIIGFQAYWLKDNYDREKRTLEIKAGVAFQETVQQLQILKLKIPGVTMDSAVKPAFRKVIENESRENVKTDVKFRKPVSNRTDVAYKFTDSLRLDSSRPSTLIIIRNDTNAALNKGLPLKIRRYDSSVSGTIYLKGNPGQSLDTGSRRQIITMVNVMRRKFGDTTIEEKSMHSDLVIRGNKPVNFKNSSIIKFRNRGDSDHVFNLLYTVDSLQDSIRLPEIVTAYSVAIKKDAMDIPFTVIKLDTVNLRHTDPDYTDVTVGFANPVTYRLLLGNTGSYLIKRIGLPILFSFFLVGVTIFSFVLLYRNLLRQQRLAEIKNDFISNITHELKTPIATVGVAIEALKNFNALHDPEKTKEYLDISANELQRLGLLVDKVLKLSMFEKKEIELNKERFNMRQLTQEVLDTMKLQFEKNNAEINFNTVGDDLTLEADKLHITSVIYNLLDNALKYSSGMPLIIIDLRKEEKNITLAVTDNGIGIAPEYQSKIFDKFFRVPTGNKHVVKGYGLGLSYVSHIIKQHKGTIQVKSELNQGSTFSIKIPVHG